MKGLSDFLTVIFLSAILLAPSVASAVTLKVYDSARHDPGKQSQLFNEAYEAAVVGTKTRLRSPTFADGKEKTLERAEKDRKRANVVEEIGSFSTGDQSWRLVIMIAAYTDDQPDTELEDVITGFLLNEADKKLAAPSAASAVTLRDYESTLNDPAKHSQLLKSTYARAVAGTLARLRDIHFTDGTGKGLDIAKGDQARANRIASSADHLTKEQTDALVKMLVLAAAAQPATELEVVISNFLERDLGQAPR